MSFQPKRMALSHVLHKISLVWKDFSGSEFVHPADSKNMKKNTNRRTPGSLFRFLLFKFEVGKPKSEYVGWHLSHSCPPVPMGFINWDKIDRSDTLHVVNIYLQYSLALCWQNNVLENMTVSPTLVLWKTEGGTNSWLQNQHGGFFSPQKLGFKSTSEWAVRGLGFVWNWVKSK